MRFKLVPHAIHLGRKVVECWIGDQMVACIYSEDRGIKVISKHTMQTRREDKPEPGVVFVDIDK